MSRELNPSLFGTPVSDAPEAPLALSSGPLAAPGHNSPLRVPAYLSAEVRQLETQMKAMGQQVGSLEKQFEVIVQQLQEFQKGVMTRFDRFSQALHRMEESSSQTNQDMNAKIGVVAGKLSERKLADHKIQEMIDRNNLMVRNFENRLTSLQRVLSEQEMQLHNAHAALDDARHELSRLKAQR